MDDDDDVDSGHVNSAVRTPTCVIQQETKEKKMRKKIVSELRQQKKNAMNRSQHFIFIFRFGKKKNPEKYIVTAQQLSQTFKRKKTAVYMTHTHTICLTYIK